MTINEYQDEVFELNINAARLAAVAQLLNEHYFERKFEAGDLTSQAWWIANHDNIQNVVGVVATAASTIKKRLEELTQVEVERHDG